MELEFMSAGTVAKCIIESSLILLSLNYDSFCTAVSCINTKGRE
ncbi:MAG TPA: hypothetical protein VFT78_07915 [Hanamia sp.]|nr:hypothetical protein [Hanamia sp.]